MVKTATLRIINDVALVRLESQPVNALGAEMRARLWKIFNGIAEDTQVKAVVILAAGRMFSAGEDIKELGTSSPVPSLSALCSLIEASKVPVVAALQGPALGGGAELAMAAHYRIALAGATIGLPEVSLGLIPGAGGTQRLPRLVGVNHALNLILGGRSIAAETAMQLGLIDGVVADNLAFDAMALAQQLEKPNPTYARREKLADGSRYLDEISKRRSMVNATGRFASARALECVEAALLLPFHTGLIYEADAFARCLAHPQSKALRHAFLAERRIAPELLRRTDRGWQISEPLGVAIVDALRGAWHRSLAALRKQGISEDAIDRAHIDYGYARGPYGGRDGGAGAQGAEIQKRVMAAIVAEGTRLVEANVVSRASDIDVLAIHGIGFPRIQGGPMMAAKLVGLLALGELMKQWSADDPVWQPPPLLLRAALMSGGFEAVET